MVHLNRAQGTGDDVGTASSFYLPVGVVVDSHGRIFVADNFNKPIRMGVPSPRYISAPVAQIGDGGRSGLRYMVVSIASFVAIGA